MATALQQKVRKILDTTAHGLPPEPARAKNPVALSAHARLLPQLPLYVLLEDELEHRGRAGTGHRALPFPDPAPPP